MGECWGVVQLAERRVVTPKVAGSNPAAPAFSFFSEGIVICMDIGTLVKTPNEMFENYYHTYGGMQGGAMSDSAHNREQWLNRLAVVTAKHSAGRAAFPEEDIVAVFFPHNREILYMKVEDLEVLRIPKKGEMV